MMNRFQSWHERGRPRIQCAETRAERDAMRAIARDIPDPADFARAMPLDMVEAMLRARPSLAGWRCDVADSAWLRSYGLVEFGGTYLTAFGLKVRRELVREDG